MKKKPSTSELLDWLKLLMVEDIGPEILRERDPKKLIPPLHGALLKNEQDVHLFERLAFMARREGDSPQLWLIKIGSTRLCVLRCRIACDSARARARRTIAGNFLFDALDRSRAPVNALRHHRPSTPPAHTSS